MVTLPDTPLGRVPLTGAGERHRAGRGRTRPGGAGHASRRPVRGAGGPDAGRDGGRVRGHGADVRGTERRGEPCRAAADRAGRRAGGPGGAGAAPLGRSGGRGPRRAEERRRLPAAGPRAPGGPDRLRPRRRRTGPRRHGHGDGRRGRRQPRSTAGAGLSRDPCGARRPVGGRPRRRGSVRPRCCRPTPCTRSTLPAPRAARRACGSSTGRSCTIWRG